MKAGDALSEYPIHTGNGTDDEMARAYIKRLVEVPLSTTLPKDVRMKPTGVSIKTALNLLDNSYGSSVSSNDSSISGSSSSGTSNRDTYLDLKEQDKKKKRRGNKRTKSDLEQCRNGFDESVLFQVTFTFIL